MNKLFGTSKKAQPAPTVNAPTLTETSEKVSYEPLVPVIAVGAYTSLSYTTVN